MLCYVMLGLLICTNEQLPLHNFKHFANRPTNSTKVYDNVHYNNVLFCVCVHTFITLLIFVVKKISSIDMPIIMDVSFVG